MNDHEQLSPALQQGIDALRNIAIAPDSLERSLSRARQIALHTSVLPRPASLRRRLVDVLAASAVLIIVSVCPTLARSDATMKIAGFPSLRIGVFEIAILGFAVAAGVLVFNGWTAGPASLSRRTWFRGVMTKGRWMAVLLLLAGMVVCYSIPEYYLSQRRREQLLVAETIRQSGWTVVEQGRMVWLIQAAVRPVTDDDLAELATHLPALTKASLDIGHSRVTDAGLEHLRGRANLFFLGLSHTAVTDKGAECLSTIEHLQVLDLAGTHITDAGLGSLSVLPLEGLDLSQTAITDDGLAKLPPSCPVFRLVLSETNVSDAGLKNLAMFPRLNWLDLAKTKVTGEPFRDFRNSPIEVLDLNGAPVTDAALANLATLQKLREVHLAKTLVTAEGFDRLGKAAPSLAIFR